MSLNTNFGRFPAEPLIVRSESLKEAVGSAEMDAAVDAFSEKCASQGCVWHCETERIEASGGLGVLVSRITVEQVNHGSVRREATIRVRAWGTYTAAERAGLLSAMRLFGLNVRIVTAKKEETD